ncbi:MAG: hypothetical protein AAGA43_16320 [Bacteroidota bacterium]
MRRFSFILFFILVYTHLCSQENSDEDILDAYEAYVELPREVVFLHTNKTTYIKGEQLGFQAYCLDKENKMLSRETRNLYVTLSDEDGLPVKQQLVKVDQGLASGIFSIDSLFTSGRYTLMAFTNWMKNFQEPNYFKQAIEVLDPEKDIRENETTNNRPDVQLLPEGGHLVMNVENTVGIVLKDNSGLGIPNVNGTLVDETGNSLGQISSNQHGHAKLTVTPQNGRTYAIKLRFEGKELEYPLPIAKDRGIVMSLLEEEDGLTLSLSTNQASKDEVSQNTYNLLIHNGSESHLVGLAPFIGLQSRKNMPRDILYPGINIFTVFDGSGKPLIERLYFNYEGISFQNLAQVDKKDIKDSTEVSLSSSEPIANVSVSVLPSSTVTYKPHHSLASYVLLQPYVKGYVENAEYYFKDVDKSKKEEMDLLLLTQGWSSYSWENIFHSPPDYDYDFEDGIQAVIEQGVKKGAKRYAVFPYTNQNLEIVSFTDGQEKLEKNGLFPTGNDFFRIGSINGKGKLSKTDVDVHFFPSQVPELDHQLQVLAKKRINVSESSFSKAFYTLNQIQTLDEVIVEATKKPTELEILQGKSFGDVEEITSTQRQRYITFKNYIGTKGYLVREESGEFLIVSQQAQNLGRRGEPSVYLDGILLNPFSLNSIAIDTTDTERWNFRSDALSVLSDLRLSDIDFIDVNKTGLGEGPNSGGVIRIYTEGQRQSSGRDLDVSSKYSEHRFDLTFAQERKYYVPKYSSYQSDFFNYYGVLNWLPGLKPNEEGLLKFRYFNVQPLDVTLFIEGITEKGAFVSQTMTIPSNE